MQVVVLAAGEGVRMKSKTPKLLHEVCGKPLVDWSLDACREAGAAEPIIVLSKAEGPVADHVRGKARIAVQDYAHGKGTGAAARAAANLIDSNGGPVVVLAVDQPLVLPESLREISAAVEAGAGAALRTIRIDQPKGYGRIMRSPETGAFTGICEDKDLKTDEQRAINEVNVSIYCFRPELFIDSLSRLTTNNAQGEYYITDIYSMLISGGHRVDALSGQDPDEGLGINDRVQLALAQAAMRRRINRRHMLAGVTLINPETAYIDHDVEIGQDTVIHPNCTLQKGTKIGDDCILLSGCRISASTIADGVTIEASVITESEVGEGTTVGPFAQLRPKSKVGKGCRIGDFVEVKNSVIADGSYASHLAYIGDADIGSKVNVGCGVITSNYDGKRKSRTVVGDGVFIGCNVNLVAPVEVGDGAYIAAGSTITDAVPPGALAIARERQTNKEGWVKNRKAAGLL